MSARSLRCFWWFQCSVCHTKSARATMTWIIRFILYATEIVLFAVACCLVDGCRRCSYNLREFCHLTSFNRQHEQKLMWISAFATDRDGIFVFCNKTETFCNCVTTGKFLLFFAFSLSLSFCTLFFTLSAHAARRGATILNLCPHSG